MSDRHPPNCRPESLMMSFGYDPRLSEGALKSPIFQTSTFVFPTAEAGKAYFELAYGLRPPAPDEQPGLIYSRLNNPDLEILEDRLRLWDKAEAAAVFASGMAAISAVVFAFARPGDVILHSEPLYGGTEHLLQQTMPAFGIEAVGFRAGQPAAAMGEALAKAGKRRLALVIVETPANPTNALVDLAAAADLAHQHGALLVVDNTFLGPLWQQPIAQGADLVVYSATKFLGGHSDVIAGAVLGRRDLMAPVLNCRTFFGSMADPWTGWLLMRSLETLKLRMTCQMKNARYVADFLADHPRVQRVHYLGHLRPEDRDYAIWLRQCSSPGSMISFEIAGGEAEAFRCLNALRLVKLAVSLGGTESLAEHPASMTHADMTTAAKQALGITPAMIRLSVGIEHPEDLIADLRQALAAM